LGTPGPELDGKAAVCTTILSSGVVTKTLRGSAGFFVDGGHNGGTGFLSLFLYRFVFVFYLSKKRKTGRVSGLKNKWFINGKGCKKDLS
jgi:hypothetical protein